MSTKTVDVARNWINQYVEIIEIIWKTYTLGAYERQPIFIKYYRSGSSNALELLILHSQRLVLPNTF